MTLIAPSAPYRAQEISLPTQSVIWVSKADPQFLESLDNVAIIRTQTLIDDERKASQEQQSVGRGWRIGKPASCFAAEATRFLKLGIR